MQVSQRRLMARYRSLAAQSYERGNRRLHLKAMVYQCFGGRVATGLPP